MAEQGLPEYSYCQVKVNTLSRVQPLRPHGPYSPWDSPAQNTRVGSLSLLQGIFPTQGLNSGLPRCRGILYQLSHLGSPPIRSRGRVRVEQKARPQQRCQEHPPLLELSPAPAQTQPGDVCVVPVSGTGPLSSALRPSRGWCLHALGDDSLLNQTSFLTPMGYKEELEERQSPCVF